MSGRASRDQGYALDPFPPEGMGVGAGSPRPGLTPWTHFRRGAWVSGRGLRDQGYALDPIPPESVGVGAGSPRPGLQAGDVSCEKNRESLPGRWRTCNKRRSLSGGDFSGGAGLLLTHPFP